MKCKQCGMPMNELRGSSLFMCISCNNTQESEDE